MTPDEKKAAIKRILALMSKTTDNGCSKEEAMSAAAKVSELLNKYQLDLSDLEIRDSKCVKGAVDSGLKGTQMIHLVIVAIGYFTDTKVWQSHEAHDYIWYNFFGLEHDVQVAEYIYKICDWAIIWEWEDWKREHRDQYAGSAKHKSRMKLSFQQGVATELSKRLREMKDAQKFKNIQSTGRDLVVVKSAVVTEEFAKLGMKLKGTKSPGRDVVDGGAYNAGREAGKRVALNPGVRRDNTNNGGLLD